MYVFSIRGIAISLLKCSYCVHNNNNCHMHTSDSACIVVAVTVDDDGDQNASNSIPSHEY